MRPNLTEKEKEHYSKVAMDMIYKSKTPRTDKAEPKIQFIKGGWVRADFAREMEIELNELKKELDNSRFGAQCSIHELEYDKNTLIKENEKLERKTNYLIPYCFECGAEYEDESCCPDKSISYIHPRFLDELKKNKFGVQQFRS